MVIALIILLVPVLLFQLLLLLIRIYGPRTGERVRSGTEYKIKGRPRKVGDLEFNGRVYLMRDHILDDFYDLIKYADELLTRNNIPYSVSYGTLLGAIRHGGIMPWDDDADFFVYAPYEKYLQYMKALEKQVASDGYELRMNYDSTFYHLVKKGARHNYPYLDFYYYLGTYREDSNVFPLKRIPFEDFEVFAPNKPMECIEIHYGMGGKSDPLKEVVNDYPLSRHYSLWTVQIAKTMPKLHQSLIQVTKRFVKLF